jgi:hypothetical protein
LHFSAEQAPAAGHVLQPPLAHVAAAGQFLHFSAEQAPAAGHVLQPPLAHVAAAGQVLHLSTEHAVPSGVKRESTDAAPTFNRRRASFWLSFSILASFGFSAFCSLISAATVVLIAASSRSLSAICFAAAAFSERAFSPGLSVSP